MKIILTEEQYNKSVEVSLDEEYPINWDIEKFKSLRSFNQRIKYCQENLQRISSGSSRIVYKIDDTKVLKLAKNPKGLAQNNVEIDFGGDYYIQSVIAKLFDSDEKGLWVEMELARRVTSKIFKRVNEVSFEDYCDAMRYQYGVAVKYEKHSRPPENMDQMWENEFVSNMIDFMVNYEIPVGDLCRFSSFGLVNRDGHDVIVLIDYGLTGEVYDSYYQ